MRLLEDAATRVPDNCSYDELLRRCPELADKDLPLRYYSRERFFGDDARAGWIEPDLALL